MHAGETTRRGEGGCDKVLPEASRHHHLSRWAHSNFFPVALVKSGGGDNSKVGKRKEGRKQNNVQVLRGRRVHPAPQ